MLADFAALQGASYRAECRNILCSVPALTASDTSQRTRLSADPARSRARGQMLGPNWRASRSARAGTQQILFADLERTRHERREDTEAGCHFHRDANIVRSAPAPVPDLVSTTQNGTGLSPLDARQTVRRSTRPPPEAQPKHKALPKAAEMVQTTRQVRTRSSCR
ncbi:hypothetical protein HRbin20_01189 [bacterium HR20]|nr:hypothetical protein HRbin20_01189 [bacterium HR20]